MSEKKPEKKEQTVADKALKFGFGVLAFGYGLHLLGNILTPKY